jgi:hypothetical protein
VLRGDDAGDRFRSVLVRPVLVRPALVRPVLVRPVLVLLAAALFSGCSVAGPAGSVGAASPPFESGASGPATPTASTSASATASPPATASSSAGSSGPPASPQPRPAGYVVVAGSHVGLVPPSGFKPSATFTGFEHPSGASIVVAELPTGLDALLPKLTDDAFDKQGIRVATRRDVTVDGRPGVLLEGVQALGGQSVEKRILVTGTDTLTAIVNGNAFDEPAGIADLIESALLTVGIDGGSVDAIGSLGFEVTPSPPLRFAGTLMNAASYNLSGRLPAADPLEPTFIAAPSIDLRAIDPTEASFRRRLESMTYRAVSILKMKPVTVGALSGFEATATAMRTRTDDKVFLYAVMLFGPEGGYVLMTGECLATERDRYEAPFRATAATYRPKSR